MGREDSEKKEWIKRVLAWVMALGYMTALSPAAYTQPAVVRVPLPAAAAPAVSAAPSEKPKTKTSGTAKQASPSQTPAASETASQVPDLMEDAYEPAMAETPVVMWPIQGEVMATFSRDTLTYSQTM